ncbi:MAG TPA: glycosyltransferase [Longimicrobiales bacterium]|nr:glycosyltransferase [Longimicrobiales bacterium]
MTDGRQPVLVLANRLPYPVDDGWKTRTFHIIQGLSRHAPLTLLTFHDGAAADVDAFRHAAGGGIDVVTVPAPRPHTPDRLLLGLVTPTPVYVWNLRSRRFSSVLRDLVASIRPGVAVAELTYMYPYLHALPPTVRRVIDTHNVDSVLLGRYASGHRGILVRRYAALTARKLRRFENRAYTGVEQVWVCSDEDAGLAADIAPRAGIRTIPNGVDTEYIRPAADGEVEPGRLLFFGRMDYEPNRDAVRYFARSILPTLRSIADNVELRVVGPGIGPELRELAADAPEIRLVGRVDDLRPELAAATAVIVPLRMGGGTRLKILEAMAAGKAIVSTTIGAEGLDVSDAEEILIADSPGEFARAVGTVLADPDLRRRLGAAARRMVEHRYDWGRIKVAAAESLWPAGSRPVVERVTTP